MEVEKSKQPSRPGTYSRAQLLRKAQTSGQVNAIHRSCRVDVPTWRRSCPAEWSPLVLDQKHSILAECRSGISLCRSQRRCPHPRLTSSDAGSSSDPHPPGTVAPKALLERVSSRVITAENRQKLQANPKRTDKTCSFFV